MAAAPVPALAHGGTELAGQAAWSAWSLTPDIVIPTALLALIYGAGAARRATITVPPPWWRHALFGGGLAAVFLALQSPIDPIAEHLFLMHQVQHLLLMLVAPILIMASAPQAVLIGGLPPALRRHLLAPVVRSRMAGSLFARLTHPATATALLGGTLYFWMLPGNFDAALADEPLHYLMDASMLTTGLLFWWRVLDRRRPPAGAAYFGRAAMLQISLMMIAFLGGYLASKQLVRYDGHDFAGLLGITALTDESLGGTILWLPGSLLLVPFLFVMADRMFREPERSAQPKPL